MITFMRLFQRDSLFLMHYWINKTPDLTMTSFQTNFHLHTE